ncbi:MAG: hypothetical protein R6V31_06160, partial [Halohasta sp.]
MTSRISEESTMATEQQQQQQGFDWNPISRTLNWMEGLSEQAYAYLLLTPAFLVLTAIALWPLWRTFRVSLYADNLFEAAKTGEFVGLANYVDVLTNQNPLLS